MGLWADFKKFAFKGNVVDMAVGVVVGGAFGKIVTSLVNDIIMPAVSVLTGGANFADLKYVITPADEAAGISEAAITYGAFIQNIVDFFLIAISVFLFVKLISMGREKLEAKKKAEEEAAAAAKAAEEAAKPKAPTQEELLTEIRDLLKNK
ncbi:MAG: large-conductance mechanosensitive channel protein MscL [Clostridia bacterium]|nr:large-conductance mechanosensitive channel protein MscL [Clostridia bacterium]